ncbi:MAG: serine/threonine protein kinase [Candidatus Obscuribacterales bacterium]
MFDPYEQLDLNNEACAPPHLNQRIAGKYLVQKMVGSGSSARVYSAKVYPGNEMVAVKVLRARSSTYTGKEMLAQEGLSLMQVNHPCFVKAHDFGETEDGEPFLVMDLLDGYTLKAILRYFHTIPLDKVLDLSMQLLDALDHLHCHGIVHASFKPSDIMVLDGERCSKMKLIDLDSVIHPAAPHLHSQAVLGEGATFHYMSPEQAQDNKVDKRADVYSFGIVLYEMVAGRMPFDGNSVIDVFNNKIANKMVPLSESRPDLAGGELERILKKCLQANPANRYQELLQLQNDIQDLRFQTPTTEEHQVDTKCWKTLPRSAYADKPQPEKKTWIDGIKRLIGG